MFTSRVRSFLWHRWIFVIQIRSYIQSVPLERRKSLLYQGQRWESLDWCWRVSIWKAFVGAFEEELFWIIFIDWSFKKAQNLAGTFIKAPNSKKFTRAFMFHLNKVYFKSSFKNLLKKLMFQKSFRKLNFSKL